MKKVWLRILFIPFIAMTPTLLFAEKEVKEEGRGKIFREMIEKLDLSPEQKASVQKMRETFRPKMKASRIRADELREKLKAQFEKEATDAELQKSFNEVQKAEGSLKSLRFEKRLAMRKILNPEQRAKFRELMKQHKDKREHE